MARRAAALLVALVLPATLLVAVAAPASGAPKVEEGLLDRLRSGDVDTFVVEFTAKADLSGARATRDHDVRGRRVLEALVRTAERSQAAAIAQVARSGARGRSYFFRNVLFVEGDADLAAALAQRPEVEAVRSERVYPLVAPVSTAAAIEAAVGDPEWGVAKIGADVAWNEGVRGAGVVVANVDTGVEYDHPALVNQYRGNDGGTFTHDYNWWDPSGICGDAPCDNAGHGTHVMGTMVGGDGPGPFSPDIGVAPSAKWIAAKGCEDFSCSEEALLSSGQFILAPTDSNGLNPDPSRRPDIVNNSWGGGPGDIFYLETVEAWRAAGIIPVFAAGNPGPSCGDGGSPGDYAASFSAGATDSNDVIADFSGRGPSPFGKVNPDISAPGVDINSSVPGGGYASFSGTSMASPHTAGALALILSAEPALIGNVEGTTDALRNTALD
ncbi:MAG: S8 family serine peptidase, partial [Actinobacteria bacterium]|nr:S8 family serine peptidase [Actinomycetota bacterium]